MYICTTGSYDTSLMLTVNQTSYNLTYDTTDDTLYNFNIGNNSYMSFRYNNSDLLSYNATINVNLTLFGNSTSTMPKIYYKICNSTNSSTCVLTTNEMKGNSTTIT
jgi:hypothetical protein